MVGYAGVSVLCMLAAVALGKLPLDLPPQFFNDNDLTELYARDVEPNPGPIAFGHKYMTGGAGEGSQQLRPEDEYVEREHIKTDSVLPAYCEPPNPCPHGFSSDDGCTEEFENTAEFSRDYQGRQDCLCDEEHMFNCPGKASSEAQQFGDALEELLGKQGLAQHKGMIAKKFHAKRA
uniref:Neuroendocrine protein 7B2 n=1 Tax=Plectus sambesii TaxID=2011161 RepID=A0A914UU43_9BILA